MDGRPCHKGGSHGKNYAPEHVRHSDRQAVDRRMHSVRDLNGESGPADEQARNGSIGLAPPLSVLLLPDRRDIGDIAAPGRPHVGGPELVAEKRDRDPRAILAQDRPACDQF
jgi:hypothetical protein